MSPPSIKKLFLAHGGAALFVNLLATSALLAALAATAPPISIILGSLTIASLLIIHRDRLSRAFVASATLGTYLVARLFALAAFLAVSLAAGLSGLILASFLALILIVIGEPTIRSLTNSAYPYAANVSGVPERNEARLGYGLVFLSGLSASTLGILTIGVHPAFMVPFLILTGVTIVVYLVSLFDVLGRVQARRNFDQTVYEHLSKLAPKFLVHWHAPTGNSYQISMWLPYLDMLGVPYVVVARTTGNFRDLQKITDRPIVLRKALVEVDDVVVPSLDAVFYVNSATRNGHLIRFAHLTHIQLNHGESDKATSYSPVFRMYDYNFVAGQAAIDRFKLHGVDVRPEMFKIVGRPQVHEVELTAAKSHGSDHEIAGGARKTVLYAPTWSGFYNDTNYSSVPFAYEMISSLLKRDCNVVFRPHPYTRHSPENSIECARVRQLLMEDEEKSQRKHLYGEEAEQEMSIFDCFNQSDAMISDVSSVVGDYLYSEKPYSMVATLSPPDIFIDRFPMARASNVLQADRGVLENLPEVLDELLITDTKAELRREMKSYFLGDIPHDTYVQQFIEVAQGCLLEARGKRAGSRTP